MSTTTRSNNRGEDRTKLGNELEKQWNTLERMLSPILFLMSLNPDFARSFKIYWEETGKKTKIEYGREVNEKIAYTIVNYNRISEIDYADIYIVDDVEKNYIGVFNYDDKLIIASAPLSDLFPSFILDDFSDIKKSYEMKAKLYTFPPENIESYIFFHLNPPVQRLVSEYLELRGEKLDESLLSNIKLFWELENAIGQVSKPPRAIMEVGELEGIVSYMNYTGRIIDVELEYDAFGTVSTEKTFSPDVTVFFTNERGEGNYKFTVDDEKSLSYIAPYLGLDAELRKILKRLGEVYTSLARGATYFGSKYKLEEIA